VLVIFHLPLPWGQRRSAWCAADAICLVSGSSIVLAIGVNQSLCFRKVAEEAAKLSEHWRRTELVLTREQLSHQLETTCRAAAHRTRDAALDPFFLDLRELEAVLITVSSRAISKTLREQAQTLPR